MKTRPRRRSRRSCYWQKVQSAGKLRCGAAVAPPYVMRDHLVAYFDWAEFERNQLMFAGNAYVRGGGQKSGSGVRALLAGMLTCVRCGRVVAVAYEGAQPGRPNYRCEQHLVPL
ncbi:hypothetical protein VB636_00815, partial [Paracoccus sp. APAP_BH8]